MLRKLFALPATIKELTLRVTACEMQLDNQKRLLIESVHNANALVDALRDARQQRDQMRDTLFRVLRLQAPTVPDLMPPTVGKEQIDPKRSWREVRSKLETQSAKEQADKIEEYWKGVATRSKSSVQPVEKQNAGKEQEAVREDGSSDERVRALDTSDRRA